MKELNLLVTTTEFNMKHWKKALDKKGITLDYRLIENTAGELFETLDESLISSNEERIIVGFAGRYTEWKNWPLAVEISKKLNEIIGDGLEIKMAIGCLDKKSLKHTKNMYAELSEVLGDRFDGKINITLEEMDKFYYDIDVFVLTSHYNTESFGRTLIEAMSRKTAVLTTNAGGSVEVVGNPNNVFDTADEFVERILDYYNNRNKLDEEKERNLKRVREVYSLDNNINKHLDLYASIINKEIQ
ncbi:MAG: glycosyltransferase family 4 protein [Caldicoprobacterales bacterium]